MAWRVKIRLFDFEIVRHEDDPAEPRESEVFSDTENQGHPRMIGFQREDAMTPYGKDGRARVGFTID